MGSKSIACKPALLNKPAELASTAATDVGMHGLLASQYRVTILCYPLVCVHCGPVVDFFITKQTSLHPFDFVRNLFHLLFLCSIQDKQARLEWFPRLRCMSLDSDEPEQEQNEIKDLQMQLSETTSLVKTLSHQLGELRDKVNYLFLLSSSITLFLLPFIFFFT